MKFVFPNDLWTFIYRECFEGVARGVKSLQFEVNDSCRLEFAPNAWTFLAIPHTRHMTGKYIMFSGSKQAAILPRYLCHCQSVEPGRQRFRLLCEKSKRERVTKVSQFCFH
jgi:hypothetical protein